MKKAWTALFNVSCQPALAMLSVRQRKQDMVLLFRNWKQTAMLFSKVRVLSLLAERQVGYFYLEVLGVKKDISKALYWTERAANHGDRDGQCNLAWFYEKGIGVEKSIEKAKYWYKESALQGHDLSIKKCEKLEKNIHQ